MEAVLLSLVVLGALFFLYYGVVIKENEKDINNYSKGYGVMTYDNTGSKDIIYLEGRNGTIKVEGNVVVISRDSVVWLLSSGLTRNGEKRILIKNIISVEVGQEPSFVGGISYIRFSTAADEEIRSLYNPSMPFTNRAGQLCNDPNTVQINSKEQYEIAIKIRDYIENKQADKIVSSNVQLLSSADEILKYKKLLDEGILTQEEFDAKKKQLLGL